MERKGKILLYISIIAVALWMLWGFRYQTNQTVGEAPSGLNSSVATSSTVIVGPDIWVNLFATTTPCTSRIVTTYSQPVTIAFSTSSAYVTATSTPDTGHIQSASTTVAYDSGIYGCGRWVAYGVEASTTVTISEFR